MLFGKTAREEDVHLHAPYRTKLFIGINVREIHDCQNRGKLKNYSYAGARCLNAALKNDKHVSNWGWNLQPYDYKSDALPLSYADIWTEV